MSQAGKKLSPPTEKRKDLDFEIEELHGRLHDSIAQWYALAVATSTIAGLASFGARGLDLVRSLTLSVMSSATATLELSTNLQQALKSRAEQTETSEGHHG